MQKKIIFPLAIFIAGLCSIIYELQISTASSYFLGDSIKQFSLTIGVYMAAMGLGSYLSRFFHAPLTGTFIVTEILLGVAGGLSIPLAYYAFDKVDRTAFQYLMLGQTLWIGVLTGLEIPLLSRIMQEEYSFERNLSNVLSLDYFGALAATLLFPFLLLPALGVFRTSVLFGLLNIVLGFLVVLWGAKDLPRRSRTRLELAAAVPALAFTGLLFAAKPLLQTWENNAFTHQVVFARQTPYQHLALTQNHEDVRLYLNRIIQFSSMDEYRYHEVLAMLPMTTAPYKGSVLILGGGEGLLAREVLKFPELESLYIVDLDSAVFELGRSHPLVREINHDALHQDKVRRIAQDAAVFLDTVRQSFDVVIADLPDPSNEAVARLYSTAFFKKILRCLRPNGIFATQATSPFHTKNAFWCIGETIRAAGFEDVKPVHAFVPTFGDWGFFLASRRGFALKSPPESLPRRFLDSTVVSKMQYFEADLRPSTPLKVNTLDQPVLLDYYLEQWANWSREKINFGDGK
jgi:spermidine synthase